jgi:hypothetical protein
MATRLDPPAPFIVGVNRSGTTLLRLMLDSHPDLAIPAETHFLPRLIRRWQRLERAGAPDGERRDAVFELVTGHARWGDLGVDAEEMRRELDSSVPLTLGHAARALYRVHAREQGKTRWGDKTPRYLATMPRIQRALPEARFVHLLRDGRDVAVSLRGTGWGTSDPAEAARTWTEEVRRGRRKAGRLGTGAYLEVRYEELVTDPERALRSVADFVDLPWDQAMLAYHERAAERMATVMRDRHARDGRLAVSAAQRAEQHAGLDEPPRPDRIGRWRSEMSAADRRRFERIAGGLLDELGYPLD